VKDWDKISGLTALAWKLRGRSLELAVRFGIARPPKRKENDVVVIRQIPFHRSSISLVTLAIVAYNEEEYLPQLFADIVAQEFPPQCLEVILVDSNSAENLAQRKLMEDFKQADHGFARVEILDNPKVIIPAGWNVALGAYSGDVFIRVDGHARIPSDFVVQNIIVLENGHDVCGGYRPVILKEPGKWAYALLAAESSAFGASAASYRRAAKAQEVKSVFHTAFRREVLDAVGWYDERLLRTEDNDFNYRVRKAGYRIICDPSIYSEQYLRPSFGGLVRQKGKNGSWIGKTLFINSKAISLMHLVPLAFFITVLGGLVVGLFYSWLPLLALAAAYLCADVVASISAAIRSSNRSLAMLALPVVFFTLHISYGAGTLFGIFSGMRQAVSEAFKPAGATG